MSFVKALFRSFYERKNMKILKKSKSITALIIALFIALSAALPIFAAEAGASDDGTLYADSETSNGLDPIPLLVIKISFDADGDGKDFYTDPDKDFGENRKKDSPTYGEQWCYSDDDWWYDQLFSDDTYSLKSYYNFISHGNFYFYPAEETYSPETYKKKPNDGQYDGVNDGIVHVVLNRKHPNADGDDMASGEERALALKAADQYVDFSKYDKNGDGFISYTELCIAFVYSGNEVSRSGSAQTWQYTFQTHAHVTSGNINVLADGVRLLNPGYSRYLRVGEYAGGGKFLTYGTFAHELGHVLGAADLYTTNNQFIGSPGGLSLMGSGSSGQAKGSGSAGTSPSIIDPYYSLEWGFSEATVADGGVNEYTLYSHESGKYNIIRVNTANPYEYYLIENRYHTKDSYDYNGINNNIQGILIWHVDEKTMRSTMAVNNGGNGHDAGLTVLTPGGAIQNTGENTAYTSSTAGFSCENYKFTYSGTWYTVMSENEAAGCKIKIDVLSEAGHEMVIRVNSSVEKMMEFSVPTPDTTFDSLTLKTVIRELNESTINSCKMYLSEDENMPENATTVKTVEPDEAGNYSFKFEGLKEATRYYYKVEFDTSKGIVTKNGMTMTSRVPVEKTYYTISIYKGLRDNEKPSSQRVDFGEKFTYSFPMTKSGYAFVGWYTDEALTQKFDMNFTQNEANDFSIYAKWVPENEAATLKFVGATVTNKVFSVLIGEKFIVPEVAARENDEFLGWYTDENFTTPFDFDAATTSAGTTTLYAKWKSSDETKEPTQSTSPVQTDPVDTAPVDPGEDNKSSSTGVIIAVVAVVVVVIAAVAVVIVVKNKKKAD